MFTRHRLPLRPLALASAALLAGCASLPWSEPAPLPDEEPTVPLTFLHLNDVYQFTPVDHGKRGGLARVATLRKQLLAAAPHALFFFGGDTLSPSVESTFHKGRQMIDAWNALGIDYAVLGNHEFDFGDEVLRQRMKESRFTWLGSNVVDRKTQRPFGDMPPFVIRELGGVRVGLLGLVVQNTKESSHPGPDVEFQDVCATARRLVPRMRAQGAQVIVALTHLSLDEDKALAHCAPVDLILGGHEHTLQQAVANGTPILKVTAEARELAHVTLHFGTRSGRVRDIDWEVLPVTPEVPEDAAFTAAMSPYAALLQELAQPVGSTAVPLDAGTVSNRTRETNLGSFVADAYRRATGADVALVNGGAIRSDMVLSPGTLTRRDVLAILPYQNSVVSIEVSGAVLRQALENGVSRSAESHEPGRFLQVSGLRYTFDVCQPPGKRVVRVTVNGEPLHPEKTYTLATLSYLTDGGDGYTMLRGAPFRVSPEKGRTTQDVLREAFSSAQVVSPREDGRIERLRGGVRDGIATLSRCPGVRKGTARPAAQGAVQPRSR